jgi:hypothetical protein
VHGREQAARLLATETANRNNYRVEGSQVGSPLESWSIVARGDGATGHALPNTAENRLRNLP